MYVNSCDDHVPLENSFVRADIIILSLPTDRHRVAGWLYTSYVIWRALCELHPVRHAPLEAHDEAVTIRACLMTKLR